MSGHGFTSPGSQTGLRMADALVLDAIEEAMGFVAAYAELARDHAKLSDSRGLEYDLKAVRAHFVFAAKAFRDMQDRHHAAQPVEVVAATSTQANLEAEFA